VQKWLQVPKITDLKQLNSKLRACFWDMDGTLINTERLHAQAAHSLLSQLIPAFSMQVDELEEKFYGETESFVYSFFKQKGFLGDMDLNQFLEQKNRSFLGLISQCQAQEMISPDVLQLLRDLKKEKILLALVTSSEREITYPLLEQLELTSTFDIILTRQDTPKNKPHPLPYLTALEKLKLNVGDALILEDSPAGLAAAHASGIRYLKANWYSHS
tara:strand:+ start:21644 stop:22291 length:648 start_codon:yes stop_codon:yes gene_type:complete